MELIDVYQPQIQILVQVALAIFLGALIGTDRELADKPAGLRTHMLVAGAAAAMCRSRCSIKPKFDPNLRELGLAGIRLAGH